MAANLQKQQSDQDDQNLINENQQKLIANKFSKQIEIVRKKDLPQCYKEKNLIYSQITQPNKYLVIQGCIKPTKYQPQPQSNNQQQFTQQQQPNQKSQIQQQQQQQPQQDQQQQFKNQSANNQINKSQMSKSQLQMNSQLPSLNLTINQSNQFSQQQNIQQSHNQKQLQSQTPNMSIQQQQSSQIDKSQQQQNNRVQSGLIQLWGKNTEVTKFLKSLIIDQQPLQFKNPKIEQNNIRKAISSILDIPVTNFSFGELIITQNLDNTTLYELRQCWDFQNVKTINKQIILSKFLRTTYEHSNYQENQLIFALKTPYNEHLEFKIQFQYSNIIIEKDAKKDQITFFFQLIQFPKFYYHYQHNKKESYCDFFSKKWHRCFNFFLGEGEEMDILEKLNLSQKGCLALTFSKENCSCQHFLQFCQEINELNENINENDDSFNKNEKKNKFIYFYQPTIKIFEFWNKPMPIKFEDISQNKDEPINFDLKWKLFCMISQQIFPARFLESKLLHFLKKFDEPIILFIALHKIQLNPVEFKDCKSFQLTIKSQYDKTITEYKNKLSQNRQNQSQLQNQSQISQSQIGKTQINQSQISHISNNVSQSQNNQSNISLIKLIDDQDVQTNQNFSFSIFQYNKSMVEQPRDQQSQKCEQVYSQNQIATHTNIISNFNSLLLRIKKVIITPSYIKFEEQEFVKENSFLHLQKSRVQDLLIVKFRDEDFRKAEYFQFNSIIWNQWHDMLDTTSKDLLFLGKQYQFLGYGIHNLRDHSFYALNINSLDKGQIYEQLYGKIQAHTSMLSIISAMDSQLGSFEFTINLRNHNVQCNIYIVDDKGQNIVQSFIKIVDVNDQSQSGDSSNIKEADSKGEEDKESEDEKSDINNILDQMTQSDKQKPNQPKNNNNNQTMNDSQFEEELKEGDRKGPLDISKSLNISNVVNSIITTQQQNNQQQQQQVQSQTPQKQQQTSEQPVKCFKIGQQQFFIGQISKDIINKISDELNLPHLQAFEGVILQARGIFVLNNELPPNTIVIPEIMIKSKPLFIQQINYYHQIIQKKDSNKNKYKDNLQPIDIEGPIIQIINWNKLSPGYLTNNSLMLFSDFNACQGDDNQILENLITQYPKQEIKMKQNVLQFINKEYTKIKNKLKSQNLQSQTNQNSQQKNVSTSISQQQQQQKPFDQDNLILLDNFKQSQNRNLLQLFEFTNYEDVLKSHVVDLCRCKTLHKLIKKGKLPLQDSAFMIAIPDPFNILEENEVFIQYSDQFYLQGQYRQFSFVKCENILVTRPYSIDLQDLHTFKIPQLEQSNFDKLKEFKNVLVVSQNMYKQINKQFTHSEFHHDQFLVIWNESIVKEIQQCRAQHQSLEIHQQYHQFGGQNQVKMNLNDIKDYFFNFINNDMFNQYKDVHLALCEQSFYDYTWNKLIKNYRDYLNSLTLAKLPNQHFWQDDDQICWPKYLKSSLFYNKIVPLADKENQIINVFAKEFKTIFNNLIAKVQNIDFLQANLNEKFIYNNFEQYISLSLDALLDYYLSIDEIKKYFGLQNESEIYIGYILNPEKYKIQCQFISFQEIASDCLKKIIFELSENINFGYQQNYSKQNKALASALYLISYYFIGCKNSQLQDYIEKNEQIKKKVDKIKNKFPENQQKSIGLPWLIAINVLIEILQKSDNK